MFPGVLSKIHRWHLRSVEELQPCALWQGLTHFRSKEEKRVLFKSIVHNFHNPKKVLDGSEALRGDVQIRTGGNQEHMEMGSWLLFQKKRQKF